MIDELIYIENIVFENISMRIKYNSILTPNFKISA